MNIELQVETIRGTEEKSSQEEFSSEKLIAEDWDEEHAKLREENSALKSVVERLYEEVDLKGKNEEIQREIIEELQLNLIGKENEMEILKNQNEKVKKGTSSDGRASLSVIGKIIKTNTEKAEEKKFLEKVEEIEILQEKFEGQKQIYQDQARHLAHKSLQAEATLAEIEARMYDRLFTKLSDVMIQKIENLENNKVLKQKVGDNTSAADIEKGKTATGSRSQGMEIVQQRKEKTHEEKSEYVSEQQELANALIHLESVVGKTPGGSPIRVEQESAVASVDIRQIIALKTDKKAEMCEKPIEGLPRLISNPRSYAEALKAPNAFQRMPSGVVNRKEKTNSVSERSTGGVSNRPSV
ncbi:hypothetical protein HHI36_001801 [Cryptolaemus montrouzieri]|uniref:Shootin-1 n=1 Tax=Cryptolaemus montrouzieri TaxID=559131 RepID=A0ABD2P8M9_9CUCU